MQSVVQTSETLPVPSNGHRLLCLGGSFNPIHVGHLICARAVAERLGFAGVRLIPAAANPHKQAADLADPSHRLAMCQAAVIHDPFFTVDSIELSRPGPSYTFDTVIQLLERPGEPGLRVAWLIGTDHLARLHLWHRFEELLQVVEFIVMHRSGEALDVEGMDPRVRQLAVRAVRAPQIEVSSTVVRQRVRAGLSVRHLVPDAVANILELKGLYG